MGFIKNLKKARRLKKIFKEYFVLMEKEEYAAALTFLQENVHEYEGVKRDLLYRRMALAYTFLDDYDSLRKIAKYIQDPDYQGMVGYDQFLFMLDAEDPTLKEYYVNLLQLLKKNKGKGVSWIFASFVKELFALYENGKAVSKETWTHLTKFKAPVAGRIINKLITRQFECQGLDDIKNIVKLFYNENHTRRMIFYQDGKVVKRHSERLYFFDELERVAFNELAMWEGYGNSLSLYGSLDIALKENEVELQNFYEVTLKNGVLIRSEVPTRKDLLNAHTFSSNHKEALLKDAKCGCFYCCRIFSPMEVTEWLDEGSGTAICPYCGIDSVVGESSGYPITENFLKAMYKYWFKDS